MSGGVREEIGAAAALIAGARRAVGLTGAGVSTPSGIPDFRSPESGLWERFDPLRVASIWGFRADPGAFYEWIAPLSDKMLHATPNPAHRALAKLERMGRLRAVITQNIDGLHQKAGSRRVLELHGHVRQAHCVECGVVVDVDREFVKQVSRRELPRCPACFGILKPAVVLFGEALPREVLEEARREAASCDLMLVAGSSLEVAPAADLPWLAARAGAKVILLNLQPTPLDALAEVVIREDVAAALPAIVRVVRSRRRD